LPGANLTLIEARSRSEILTVHSYEVRLDVTRGDSTFEQETTVRFSCSAPGAETFIDAVATTIHSATLNGTPVDTSGYDGEMLCLVDLAEENVLVFTASSPYSNTGEGLHRFVDPVDDETYLYTQFEPNDAQRMYACFDQPDLKATFTLSVTAPAHWEVVSNSPVASRDKGEGSDTWHFQPTPRISTYITALVAGPYHVVSDVHQGKEREIPLGIYCRKSLAQYLDADAIFEVTKQGFTFFEEEFGLAYPFEKYDQLAVPEFNAGAMENSGCVTFAEDYFVFRSKVTDRNYNWRANTILHEMAHMWFGDLVTMVWWNDLWLNESFAEWASYTALGRATRFTNSWVTFNAERKNWAYRQDQLSSTHPIVADVPDLMAARNNLDGITYAKGASALQLLANYCGEENFITGLRRYFAKHQWGNATLADLISELEAASGRDLSSWSATWLQTAGVNTLRPEITIEGENYSSVAIRQEAPRVPEGSRELRPHRLAVGLYDLVGDAVVLRRSEVLDVSGERTEVTALAGERVADLLLINDGDLSYAKVRFDERSIATLIEHLGKIVDPMARALCWAAAWDMLRDGELTASAFVPMAMAGLSGESDISVVQTTLTQLETAVELYAAEAHRAALRGEVASGLEGLLGAAPAGSDRQLAFVRSLATFASTESHVAAIAAMLDGSAVATGLMVDQDLRWHLLLNLVSRGAAGSDRIDAELAADNTAQGKKAAASCRAALPSAEAKEAAFALAIAGEVPNHIQLATITGFQRPLQRDLIAPYVSRYFDVVLDRWESLSYEIALNIARWLFPNFVTTQETLTAAEAWLAANASAPAGLLRIVAEQRDALARALRAQEADAR
jgi:aminopeptidase N